MFNDCKDCGDARKNCVGNLQSSTCTPYTGYISPLLTDLLPCSPNVDDLIKQAYLLLEKLKANLGDNTLLDKMCFSFLPASATQAGINQEIITKICDIVTQIAAFPTGLNITALDIMVNMNLLCLESDLCTPVMLNTLQVVLTKMRDKICDHETRIEAIETYLGI